MGARQILSKIGTVIIVLGILGIGSLVAWNVFGQGPYGDTCSYSIGCRSFYCVKHELRGERQWAAPKGMCTKSCDADKDCGADARCVALTDDTKDDLPPFGKPDKACLHVRPLDPDDRH
ncbi:MAG: hypothetical protein ABI678_28785 [Kofleriaceae bacterium]